MRPFRKQFQNCRACDSGIRKQFGQSLESRRVIGKGQILIVGYSQFKAKDLLQERHDHHETNDGIIASEFLKRPDEPILESLLLCWTCPNWIFPRQFLVTCGKSFRCSQVVWSFFSRHIRIYRWPICPFNISRRFFKSGNCASHSSSTRWACMYSTCCRLPFSMGMVPLRVICLIRAQA